MNSLEKLEAELRREAHDYLQRASNDICTEEWLVAQVSRLTGLTLQKIGKKAASERINKMLNAQTRWSRIRHPGYDLNRHIILQKIAKALAAPGEADRPGN